MAFCGSCGAETGGSAFCPKCGAAQGAAAPAGGGSGPAPAAAGTESMQENLAGLLCYVFGWLSGLIFLLIDKRPFVKFHGAQSIAFNISFVIVWIGYLIFSFIITAISVAIHIPIGFLSFFLMPVIGIAFLGTWIFLMIKAYGHEKFKLPIIGNMVEKMVGA
jgi:uncharacterized membrane protein